MAATGVQVRRGVEQVCASTHGKRQRKAGVSEPIEVSHFDQITCSPKITMVLGV
jgi:hypothetical protein